jgi:hypothetical protein
MRLNLHRAAGGVVERMRRMRMEHSYAKIASVLVQFFCFFSQFPFPFNRPHTPVSSRVTYYLAPQGLAFSTLAPRFEHPIQRPIQIMPNLYELDDFKTFETTLLFLVV